jgi:signal transduction histidine kinase
MTNDFSTANNEPPPEEALYEADPVRLLAAALANAVAAVGGRAGLIILWDSGLGVAVHSSSTGLAAPDQAELEALVRHAAPALLGALPVDGGAGDPTGDEGGSEPAYGWQIDARAAEARIQTRLGRLHLLAFPVLLGPGLAAPPATDGEGAAPPRLVGLLSFVHPQRQLNLRQAHPTVYNMIVAEVALVMQNVHLVQHLINEARWLAAVLEHTSEGLLILDPRGRVVGCNAAGTQIIGWTAAELRGRDLVATLDPHRLIWVPAARTYEEEPWAGPFAAPDAETTASAPGATVPPLDLVLTTRNGTRIYTEGRAAVVTGPGGEVLGAMLSLRDVTAQREAEELQATFLSVISHELQTPLAVIRGYAELLADEAGRIKPRELRQKLGIVAEESAKLSKMVTNLLDASRIQAGGLELKPEPVDLRRLVERVVQKITPLSSKHRFEIAMSHDLPPVLADYERVEQVLTNLLENAIKYSPAGGTILITGDLTSDEVIIHVSDEGIGVPEADRQRIFSRFHRLNSRQVRQMKGVGLGLYIARAIVGAHGGRIWADAAPGGGAQFSFSLPRQHKAPLPILFGRG